MSSARLGDAGRRSAAEVLEQLAEGDKRVHLDLGIGVPGARVRPRRNCSQSSGGAPSISAIIRVGSGAARLSANSTVESDRMSSRIPLTISRTFGSSNVNLAAGEAGVDQLAQLTVPRRIGEDQVALLDRVRHRRVGNRDALGRRELVRVPGHEPDVLVLQQRPELRDVVPAHRRRSRAAPGTPGTGRRRRSRASAEGTRYAGRPPSTRIGYQTYRHDLSDQSVST